MTERLCTRCKHPDHWHRHDDEACLSKHPQPCAPAGCGPGPIHPAPFRCLGYDCEGPVFAAGTPESRCGCPDFQAPLVDAAPPAAGSAAKGEIHTCPICGPECSCSRREVQRLFSGRAMGSRQPTTGNACADYRAAKDALGVVDV